MYGDTPSLYLFPNSNKARKYDVGNLALVVEYLLDPVLVTRVMFLLFSTCNLASSLRSFMLSLMIIPALFRLWRRRMIHPTSGRSYAWKEHIAFLWKNTLVFIYQMIG
jgi:hypothetical protein